MELHIRRAEDRDIPWILQSTIETARSDIPLDEKDLLEGLDWESTFKSSAKAVMDDPGTEVYVAEGVGGERMGYLVVGCAKTMFTPLEFGFVYDIYVEERFRRRGVGKRLLQLAEDFCRKRGLKKLKLEVSANNRPGLTLYNSSGFSPERVFMGKRVE